MDLYPQPGLLKSQIAALTRPHCTPSGFTITYVLSEPPCIQCHLSKQAFAHRKINLWRWPIQCSWNQNWYWWRIQMTCEDCMSLGLWSHCFSLTDGHNSYHHSYGQCDYGNCYKRIYKTHLGCCISKH
jgi:hypothetical protein